MAFISSFTIIRNQNIIKDDYKLLNSETQTIDAFLDSVYLQLALNYPKFYKMDRLSKLGFLASEVLLKDQYHKDYQPAEVAIVLSNAQSSLDTDIRYQQSLKTMASPALFVYTLPNIVTGEICIRNGFKGENAFFITPEFDALLLQNYVEMLLMQPNLRACIAGWIDVLDEHHDVFLYLAENQKRGLAKQHTADELKRLYSNYGTIDGRA
jgi:hypothetical protein